VQTELLLWVDNGPSPIPIADVHRNVCYPHTHRSQFGQLQPFGR